jgi:peptidoglycan hydrolase-like protein with peptidoglycan-binding domain
VLVQIHPEWRGDHYFVVNDDVVIVNREHRIVATRPVGSSSAANENRGGGGGPQFRTENISSEQIRKVQRALVQQGYDIEVDGIWGPNTRHAVVEFQQHNRLQATGQLDQKTFASLTSSSARTPQGNQGMTSTTGQAPAGQGPGGQGSNTMKQPAAKQPQASQPQMKQPQANQQQSGDSTSGQGGSSKQSRRRASQQQHGHTTRGSLCTQRRSGATRTAETVRQLP